MLHPKGLAKSRRFRWPHATFIVIALSLAGISSIILIHAANAPTASPGGTYSDWYFPSNLSYTSLEWTFVPLQDPPASLTQAGLLHYYAYNFGVANATSAVGSGYAGFQSNGIFNGTSEGKAINFSIWGSNGGTSPTGLINPANTESGGYQIMLKYPWTVGRHYTFQLKASTTPSDSLGKWWGLWVTDTTTNITTLVGQERVPATIDGLTATTLGSHTSMFGEDTHWWNSLDGSTKYKCSDFQNSALATIQITANGGSVMPASFTTSTNSGQSNTGSNGYLTTNCPVTVYSDKAMNVQQNLGYWPTAAPNHLTSLEKPGDIDGNGHVDIFDLSILASHYGSTNATLAQGDLNGDSKVNIFDLSILAAHWGT